MVSAKYHFYDIIRWRILCLTTLRAIYISQIKSIIKKERYKQTPHKVRYFNCETKCTNEKHLYNQTKPNKKYTSLLSFPRLHWDRTKHQVIKVRGLLGHIQQLVIVLPNQSKEYDSAGWEMTQWSKAIIALPEEFMISCNSRIPHPPQAAEGPLHTCGIDW